MSPRDEMLAALCEAAGSLSVDILMASEVERGEAIAQELRRLGFELRPPSWNHGVSDLYRDLNAAIAVDEDVFFNDDRVEHGRHIEANIKELGYDVVRVWSGDNDAGARSPGKTEAARVDLCDQRLPTDTWGLMWCGLFRAHPRGGQNDGHHWYSERIAPMPGQTEGKS
jgi:hypothetical protein